MSNIARHAALGESFCMYNEAFGVKRGVEMMSASWRHPISTEVAKDGSWRGGYRAPQLFSFPPGDDILSMT